MEDAPIARPAEPDVAARSMLGTAIRWGVIASLVVVVGAMLLWSQRKPIADSFIADALQERGVEARYELAGIGLATQRVENLVIGDPADPDLTARWAEIEIRAGLSGVRVLAVRAAGVRLKAALRDGALDLGAVDRLLPEPDGQPFRLPDLELELTDARAMLTTPAGPVALAFEGRGNASRRLSGVLAVDAPQMIAAGCRADDLRARLAVSVSAYRPSLKGPLRMASLACPDTGLAAVGVRMPVEARLSPALDRWEGEAMPAIAGGRFGDQLLAGVGGRIGFDGTLSRTAGVVALDGRQLRVAGIEGRGLKVQGPYTLGWRDDRLAASFTGGVRLARASLGSAMLGDVRAAAVTAKRTPVGPLGEALALAIARAGRSASAEARIAFDQRGERGSLTVSAFDLASASGFRARLGGGQGWRIGWPGSTMDLVDARLRFGGGGMPSGTADLAQASSGAPVTGTIALAPYASGGARLALAPVRFTVLSGGGSRVATRITLDGPLGDGRIEGLTMPVGGSIGRTGGFALDPGCVPLSFRHLAAGGMALQPAVLRLCPDGASSLFERTAGGGIRGGVRIASPRLVGRIGDRPIGLAAADVRVMAGQPGFAARQIAVSLGGSGDEPTRLALDGLDGRIAATGIAGRFAGLSGKLANVPLLVSGGEGGWRLAGGVLDLDGRVQVSDAAPVPRFNPLDSRDFALRFADARITAEGWLTEPRTGVQVTRVAIRHDLDSGSGDAVLDVPSLVFGDALQPERLTRLTLGVIANVRGEVAGRGTIRWNREGVASDGEFATAGMDLAAAFGPVRGLTGAIRFTDLLGMVSAPGQTVRLASVNPGIEVNDGIIRYQLIGEQRMRIEDGRWPFSGGELLIDPGILDLGEARARHLTFKVTGLDAGTFIQRFDFKDIYVTGTFDGVLPMIFDADGGRIDGGRLVVRPGGGQLAYVGQLSNEDLGAFGTMAFDTLKSMRYDRLVIELDGALDGEMVSRIVFNGVNRGTGDERQTGITAQFIGLPFIFNIAIKAPFRQLITTAQGFYDPGLLIQQRLPELLRENRKPAEQPVQRPESETMR